MTSPAAEISSLPTTDPAASPSGGSDLTKRARLVVLAAWWVWVQLARFAWVVSWRLGRSDELGAAARGRLAGLAAQEFVGGFALGVEGEEGDGAGEGHQDEAG